jgi:uncharacterized tellurite resistance protein B-like protein
MLKEVISFFSDLTGTDQPRHFEDNDYRVAVAALLVHVATLDGDLDEADRDKLHDLLKSRFELDEEQTAELINAAVAADNEAVDFYHFTSVLMRKLDEPARERIIEMMWRMVYVDHVATEFEDNVVWRVADLLGISARNRLALKRRVANEDGAEL